MFFKSNLWAIFIALFYISPAHAEGKGHINFSHSTKEVSKFADNSVDSIQKKIYDTALDFNFDDSIQTSQAIPDFSGVTVETFPADVDLNFGPEFFGIDNSCALSFSQGCNKGPYLAILYIGNSPNSLPFSSDNIKNKETYKLLNENSDVDFFEFSNPRILIESDYKVKDSSEFKAGASIAFGYDFGGFRSELLSSYSNYTQKLSVDGGFVKYTVFEAGGDNRSFSSPKIPVGDSISGVFTNTKPSDLELNINTYSFLIRNFVDIPTGSRFSPFFGIGLGAKYIDVGSDASEGWDICSQSNRSSGVLRYNPCPAIFKVDGGTTTVFTGQAIAGISFVFTKNLSLNSEVIYDYTGPGSAGDYKFSGIGYFTGSLGLRYKF